MVPLDNKVKCIYQAPKTGGTGRCGMGSTRTGLDTERAWPSTSRQLSMMLLANEGLRREKSRDGKTTCYSSIEYSTAYGSRE